jgi:DNA-binding GntR family transcriptional regulator
MPLVMPWLPLEEGADTLSQIRDVPLARLIREDVLASILRGDLVPGERITEPVIAARLGVSRVPVREALRDLESTGLVESRKHAGVFVRQLSAKETADLYQMRAVLDAFAGRAAATAHDQVLLDRLHARLIVMEQAAERKDVTRYYEANLNFHWDIISASGNQQICDVYRGLVQKLHVVRLKNLSSDIGMLESLREHHAIVEAIDGGDPQACAALMENHVKSAGVRLADMMPVMPSSTTSPRNENS